MAKSSINIQPSSGNAIIHNERIFDVAYAIKKDDVNEYHRFASISETRKAIYEDYKLHHGRKLNTKATPIREAVVNLNQNHKMEDLINLSQMLENDYQMKVLHIAIHRDEGHIDKDGKENINYHAHLVFHNYDFDKHITIKRDKDVMRKLQTDVAKSLGMERGLENSQAVRLDHRQYKRAMQEVEVKTKDLTKANELLKEELKEVKKENADLKYNFKEMQKTITSLENLTAEQKRELHSLNSKVKNEKAEYEELLKKIEELKKDIFHPVKKYRDNTPAKNIDVVQYFEKKSDTLENQNKALQEQNKVLENKVITLEDKIVSSSPQNDLLIKEIKDLKEKVTVLENENKSLKQKIKDIVSLANEKIKSLFQFKIWNNYKHKQTRYDREYINENKEDYWEELVYDNPRVDTLYKDNIENELLKIDDFIPGEKETLNYSKMNLEDILKSNPNTLKEAQDNLKELLEKGKQETVVHTRKLF